MTRTGISPLSPRQHSAPQLCDKQTSVANVTVKIAGGGGGKSYWYCRAGSGRSSLFRGFFVRSGVTDVKLRSR